MFFVCQRPAYLPEQFLKESKPPWFSPNVQHDCSEFLKYLLDQLHEQELSVKPPTLPQPRPASASTLTKSDTMTKKKRSAKGLLKMLTLSKRHTVCDLEVESPLPMTLVERTFGGKIVSSYVCLQCRTESSKSETFTDLALAFPEESGSAENSSAGTDPTRRTNGARLLPGGSSTETAASSPVDGGAGSPTSLPAVKSVSLESLLEHFLRPERLVGSNQYQCSKCGGLRDGERRTVITFAPPCLVLPLLRFAYDTQTGQHNKICTDVLCPLTLRVPINAAAGGETLNRKTSKSATRHVDYTLASVIVHSGLSSDGGHYYCYAHHPVHEAPPPARSGRGGRKAEKEKSDAGGQPWFMFNDNRVIYSSYESIRTLTQTFSRDTAYVLFYRRAEADTAKGQRPRVSLNEDIIPATSTLRLAVEDDNRLYREVSCGVTAWVSTPPGKSGIFFSKIPGPGKSWKLKRKVLESPGKYP